MLRKQLFYLTNDQLSAYQWDRGRLLPGQAFSADRAGMEAFSQYLDQHPDTPAYLVADVIEEDFTRHSVPHVGGRAGRELVERRAANMYRDTPYRHASIQGRETEGRRDDRVLFSALTNPALVQGWIALLEQRSVPLAALYSTTLLSTMLVRKLGVAQPHLLLVTQQSGGLRQSYFQDLQLKFSRLTPAAEGDAVAANIKAETAKTQQFLTSTRLLGRGEMMHVVILTGQEHIAALDALCEDGPEISYQFTSMDTAAARLRLDSVPTLSDRLLLTLVGKRAPPSHYDLGNQNRFYRLWQARAWLYGATAATLAICSLWLLSNMWNMVTASNASARLRSEALQLDARHSATLASMPPSVTKTANMKAAVQIEHMIATQAPLPGPLMGTLSMALEQVPQITLTMLDWQVERAPAPPAGQAQGNEGSVATTPPISSITLGIPNAPAQTVLVEADVNIGPGDYRGALESMNMLMAVLARTPGMQVEVVEPPLDVRPSVKLTGKAGVERSDSHAKFVLKLVYKS